MKLSFILLMLVGIVSVVIFGTGMGAGRAQEEQTLNKNPPTYDHVSLANTGSTSNTAQNNHFLDIDAYTSLLMAKVAKAAADSNNTNSNSSTGGVLLPATAIGPKIPPKGYLVQQIRGGLYWLTDGAYQTMFMVTDKGVVAVDAPPTIGNNYLKAIAEVTNKPVTYVIYSHAHLDHIGSAGIFPKNATYIAQEETTAELQRAKATATNASAVPPIPTVSFAKNYRLQIGNQTLQLDYYGNNHIPGNIFIYAPSQKVLMLVDVVFPGWVPYPYLAVTTDVGGFTRAHDIALNNYNFDTFIGGHLTRIGTRNDVIVQKEFISDLEKAAGKANHDITFGSIAKQVGHFENPWFIFKKYNDAVDGQCARDMLAKWENKLGGAQEFMETHCYTMGEALRIVPDVALTQSGTFAYK
jgi:glyoxylase-like metal-dependent hydrolase (beta-lactamase superfamily II)